MSKHREIKPATNPDETRGMPASQPPRPIIGSPSSNPPKQPTITPKK